MNYLPYLTFDSIIPLFFKSTIEKFDLKENKSLLSEDLKNRIHSYTSKFKEKDQIILFSLFRMFLFDYLLSALLKLASDTCILTFPVLLKYFLGIFKTNSIQDPTTYYFILGIFLIGIINMLVTQGYLYRVNRTVLKAKVAINLLIYEKSLRVRSIGMKQGCILFDTKRIHPIAVKMYIKKMIEASTASARCG